MCFSTARISFVSTYMSVTFYMLSTQWHKDIAKLFQVVPKYLTSIFFSPKFSFENLSRKLKDSVPLTISWSETGPKLVTKMSVFTSVTRSGGAGNEASECLSTVLIRYHHHILTPKWETYWLWLAVSKIGPQCSPRNSLLTHEISQLIFSVKNSI